MLRILIVDDQPTMQAALDLMLEPLRLAWPDCVIIKADTFEQAVAIANKLPSPDVILLDLSLPDSTMESTLLRLSELSNRCPVVIITGHREESLKSAGFKDEVPVIFKDSSFIGEKIIRAICIAITVFRQNEWDRMERNIQRMKELSGNAP